MVMVHIFILKYHATNLDVEKIIWMYYCENNFLGRMENDYCRVTDCSPHLDGNREWAQQSQYNKFIREWVEELG